MELQNLISAIQAQQADDAFRPNFTELQWRTFAGCLERTEVASGLLLVRQGETRRLAYLLERGSLEVFVTGGPPSSHRIAVLKPGAIVGEPALFKQISRMANVETMSSCAVWCLTAERVEALCQQDAHTAVELMRAAGAVMASRMRSNLVRGIPIV
jgi:CRP/FNR family transcriptional regulator, cyclic AMP receptor protein